MGRGAKGLSRRLRGGQKTLTQGTFERGYCDYDKITQMTEIVIYYGEKLGDQNMLEIPEFPIGFLKEHKENWKRIWTGNPHLNPDRDFLAVQILCDILVEYRIVLKLSKEERLLKQPNGIMQSHPYIAQVRELRKEIDTSISSLGLSPLAASKLQIEDSKKSQKQKELAAPVDRSKLGAK